MALTKISNEVIEQNLENYLKKGLKAGSALSDLEITTYANAAGINPVDGLGGSAGITVSLNTSSPLSGDADLRIVKDASNRQGNGISIPFTIDNRHLAKVLQISFDAELISGNYENPIPVPIAGTYSITSTTCTVTAGHSFVQGQSVFMTFTSGSPPANGFYTITSVTATTFVFTVASGSSTGNCNYTAIGDLRISIIQDPSGTPVVLEPVNVNLQLGIVNQRIRHIATFQTHISITSYRFCIHVGSVSTVAYTIDFANFKIWEPVQSIGNTITDWQSYTPIMTPAFTNSSQDFQWRRVGGNIEIQGRWVASSTTANESRIPLPFGSIDSLKISSIRVVGVAGYNAAATTYFGTYILAEPSVSYLTMGIQTSTLNAITKVNASTMGNNTYTMFASVPIAGWGSSVAMSSDTGDGRVVAAKYTGMASASVTASTIPFKWTTRSIDTHNAYDPSTGRFTAPINGIYRVSLTCSFDLTAGSIFIFKNGIQDTYIHQISSSTYVQGGSTIVSLNAGDYIDVRQTNGSYTSYANNFVHISIERISAGSQVIASSETVAASYYSAATQTSLTTQINFGTAVYDTHGAVTTGTSWKFTAPMSGRYRIQTMITTSQSNWFQLFKNNTLFLYSYCYTQATNFWGVGVTEINLLAGEYIDIRPTSSSNVLGGTLTSANISRIEISRIGN